MARAKANKKDFLDLITNQRESKKRDKLEGTFLD